LLIAHMRCIPKRMPNTCSAKAKTDTIRTHVLTSVGWMHCGGPVDTLAIFFQKVRMSFDAFPLDQTNTYRSRIVAHILNKSRHTRIETDGAPHPAPSLPSARPHLSIHAMLLLLLRHSARPHMIPPRWIRTNRVRYKLKATLQTSEQQNVNDVS
jgi:hypothetical protein